MKTWNALSGRGWIPWALFALLSIRLLARVSHFAVDQPYADQWDLWDPLFTGEGPWTFFRFQFGPVRQGVGGLVMLASAAASGWSTRAETFVSAGIVIAGAALFMLSARRIRGALGALDAIFPLILLNGLLAEAITDTPNPAHGPVPYFLLCAAPLCFEVRRAWSRLPLLVGLTVALTYTGFAVVAVPLVLALQAIEVWRSSERLAPSAALVASALLSLTFLIGYTPSAALACFAFPDPEPARYLPFAALVLARPLVLDGGLAWFLIAAPVTLAVIMATGLSAWRLATRPSRALDRVVLVLSGAATLFAASTAIGRVCLGTKGALAVRYVPYVLPGLAGAVLLLRAWSADRRPWVTATLLLLCAGQHVALELWPSRDAEYLADAKRRYASCLRSGWTASVCAIGVGHRLYPDPAATHLDEKVELMRERHVGPFRPIGPR